MRIVVYGGSFNPPHVGHACVASWLRWTDVCDEVWMVPAFGHAFKADLAPFEARLALCEAFAAAVGPWVKVSAIESERPPPSYTIDTLDELARRFPAHRFRLVVGADILAETHKWRAWDRIMASYSPVIVGRQGYPSPEGAVSFPEVSSTAIREALGRGESVDHLVPAAVAELLARTYSTSPEGGGASAKPKALPPA